MPQNYKVFDWITIGIGHIPRFITSITGNSTQVEGQKKKMGSMMTIDPSTRLTNERISYDEPI